AAGEDPRSREVRGGRRGPRAQDDRHREGGGDPPAAAGADQAGEDPPMSGESTAVLRPEPAAETGTEPFPEEEARLLAQVRRLEESVRNAAEQQREMLQIVSIMNELHWR